jgi:hypothetical protein
MRDEVWRDTPSEESEDATVSGGPEVGTAGVATIIVLMMMALLMFHAFA